MNAATIGLPERSWSSESYRTLYERNGNTIYGEAYRASPTIWRMVPFEIALAPGTQTGVGALAALPTFFFPRHVKVTGLYVMTTAGISSAAAILEIGILDLSGSGAGQIVTNGRFDTTAPALALGGRQHAWYPLERDQEFDTRWQFTLANTSAATTITPIVLLRVVPIE